MRSELTRPAIVTASIALAIGLAPAAAARTSAIDRFTANALNIGGDMNRPAAALVQIDIDRWSTDTERDHLLSVLATNEQAKAIGVLTDLPRAGMIRTPELGGDPLYYASRTIASDKSERIVLIASRPIRSFESSMKPGMSSYPFSVIDLRLAPDGRGSGTVTLGARLKGEREFVTDSDRVVQPVRLTMVKRVAVKTPNF